MGVIRPVTHLPTMPFLGSSTESRLTHSSGRGPRNPRRCRERWASEFAKRQRHKALESGLAEAKAGFRSLTSGLRHHSLKDEKMPVRVPCHCPEKAEFESKKRSVADEDVG